MPEHNQPLEPTPFEPARPQPGSQRTAHHAASTSRLSGAWLPAALGLLIGAALLVFFWLPDNVPAGAAGASAPASEEQQAVAKSKASATPATTAPAAAVPEQSPWADAQQARLRLAAQDILADLIDLQFALEEQGVEQWAPDAFAAAAELATKGDGFYRAQQYTEASERYQQGLQILRETSESIPQRIDALVQGANTAIDGADLPRATDAVTLLAVIDPDNSALTDLQARLATLPALIAALGKARQHEEQGELTAAANALEQAVALDPLHRGAAQALDRVNANITERDFQNAMSRGYGKLGSGEHDAAIAAFEAARALKPGSAEAASAITEAQSLRSANQLITLKDRGLAHESQEQWPQAVAVYETALAIDGSILFAREGLERSTGRAAIARQFSEIMADPDRLTNTVIAEQARAFLRHSEGITPRGPVLQAQISDLNELLQRYSTPVSVTVNSDGQTDIVIYKVGKLGSFERRTLKLRPGAYTAVGSRLGYRDVRKSFRVSHTEPESSVTVICTEPI
ncbi:MAG: hypothetical protein NXI15_15350 [Gammaproteobacteria bacterium]|nr:hypothetical protein [Gammaproteobacteria bacterium]